MYVTSANSVAKPIGAETPTDALGTTKRMSSLEAEGQESTDVKCPSCDATFETERGVKLHHSRTHGESLAMVQVECDCCGDVFNRHRSSVESYSNNYCGEACQAEALRKRIQVACDNCGGDISRQPGNVNEHNFCSVACKGEWMSKTKTGTDALHWQGGKEKSVCERCGEGFKHHKNRSPVFCGEECFHKHLSENAKPASPYYGASWRDQRQKAVERDGGECVICGEEPVDVHHIRPFREFGVENHEQANRLDNLVCLCRGHHSKWEGIPLRPEVAE